MKRCSRCILPESFPGINFDENGVCNYCLNYETTDFSDKEEELRKILDKYRNNGGKQDCVITYSGGRDSAFLVHQMVKSYKMNPLLITYDWGMMTPEAHKNWEITKGKLGLEHIVIKPDIKKIKRNIRLNIKAWLKKPHLGMVPIFTQGDKQAEYYIEKIVRKRGIELVLIGGGNHYEHTTFKTGFFNVYPSKGRVGAWNLSGKDQTKLMFSYLLEYLRNLSYINISLIETLKAFFHYFLNNTYRKNELSFKKQKTRWVRFYRYIKWDEQKVLSTIKNELDWVSPEDTALTWRTDDCTAPLYNYLHYTMVGFTENDTFRSNQIREGVLSREEALRLVENENQPRIDAMKKYLESLNLSFDDFKNLPKFHAQ